MLDTRANAHPVTTAPERGSQSPQHSPDRNGTASDPEQEETPVDSPLRIGASLVDYALVFVYSAVVLLIGLAARRRVSSSLDFFLSFRRCDQGDGLAEGLLGGVAVQQFRSAIPARDLAVWRGAQNGINGGLDYRCHVLAGFDFPRFRPRTLARTRPPSSRTKGNNFWTP